MSTPTYTEMQLQALRDALAKGEKRVTFGDKTVEYRTVEELKQASPRLKPRCTRMPWPPACIRVRRDRSA